jgi:hypothetical protein
MPINEENLPEDRSKTYFRIVVSDIHRRPGKIKKGKAIPVTGHEGP